MILIAVPFYSNVPYLKETLESLTQQTDSLWRAIVLDNSVKDEETRSCEATVREVADERIQYRRNERHLEMAANWNQAFDLCKGYTGVTILHSDDRLLPDYVKVMNEAFAKFPETSAFFARTTIVDENGKPAFSFADAYKKLLIKKSTWITLEGMRGIKALIPGNFVFCPTLCFNTQKIGNERFNPSMKMVVDFDLTLRILLDGGTLRGYYAKPLYEYRRHEKNLTSQMNKNMVRFQEEYDLYQDLAKKLFSKGEYSTAALARKAMIVKYHLIFQMALQFTSGHWGRIPQYFQFLKSLN